MTTAAWWIIGLSAAGIFALALYSVLTISAWGDEIAQAGEESHG